MKTITQSFKIIALALILSLGVSYVSAWTAPTVAPTGGNTASPLNTSTNTQYKAGLLGVDMFRSFGNLIVDGNIGIGTTTPGVTLDVRGHLNLQDSANNAGVIYFPNTGTLPNLYIRSDDVPSTWESASERMFIGANGNVGIGTTAPTAKLDITGTNGFGIRYVKTGSRDARIAVGDPTKTWSIASGWATAGDFSIIEENVAGDRLYIKQGGNVGIGTIVPSNILDITTTPTGMNTGISLNGKTALTASAADTWLRLNNSNQFASGVYTPGYMTADGGFSTTWSVAPPAGGIYSAGDISTGGYVEGGLYGGGFPVWTNVYTSSSCAGTSGVITSWSSLWGVFDVTTATKYKQAVTSYDMNGNPVYSCVANGTYYNNYACRSGFSTAGIPGGWLCIKS